MCSDFFSLVSTGQNFLRGCWQVLGMYTKALCVGRCEPSNWIKLCLSHVLDISSWNLPVDLTLHHISFSFDHISLLKVDNVSMKYKFWYCNWKYTEYKLIDLFSGYDFIFHVHSLFIWVSVSIYTVKSINNQTLYRINIGIWAKISGITFLFNCIVIWTLLNRNKEYL